MSRLILLLTVALMAFALPSNAEAVELFGEYRFTMVKGAGQAIEWRSGYAGALDFGLPVDLGLAILKDGNVGSDSGASMVDAYLTMPIYTFYSRDSSKSLRFETYLAMNLQQGVDASDRSGAFGLIWDPGLKQPLTLGLRGAFNNYDWIAVDGSTTSLTDFSVQTVFQISLGTTE